MRVFYATSKAFKGVRCGPKFSKTQKSCYSGARLKPQTTSSSMGASSSTPFTSRCGPSLAQNLNSKFMFSTNVPAFSGRVGESTGLGSGSSSSPSGSTASGETQGSSGGNSLGGAGKSVPGVESGQDASSETPTGRSRRQRHISDSSDDPGGGRGNIRQEDQDKGETEADEAELDPKRTAFAIVFFGVIGSAAVFFLGQPGPNTPDDSNLPGNPIIKHVKRAWFNATHFWTSFKEPISAKLLPDPLPDPYQPPYTLVISLDDLLVHSVWEPACGWKITKRPGVDFFLAYMAQFYEIVLFTSGMAYNAEPVITKLDPFNYVTYRLYRDSCRYVGGKYIKDLSCLNRDLSKVLVLDTEDHAVSKQPENAIILKPWTGDSSNDDLLKMVDFLEALALFNVQDVRPALKAYEGQYIPEAYTAWQIEQRRLQAEKVAAAQVEQEAALAKFNPIAIVSKLFGRNVTSSASIPSPQDSPIAFIDHVRKQMRHEFAHRQADFQKAALQQLQKQRQDVEQHMASLKGSSASMWDWMTQGGMDPNAAISHSAGTTSTPV